MRVHVALTPAEFPALDLGGRAALVVDVLRATTAVVAACEAGCRAVIPVADTESAVAQAAGFRPGEVLLAGERGGEAIPGFDLGNSPLELTVERVRGRTIILTTTNGTAAMLVAAAAGGAALAALTNIEAAARWALAQGRDVTILCAGERGAFSLEDAVCAGLLVARLRAVEVELSDAAMATLRLGEAYEGRLARLAVESHWARQLARRGRSADVARCLDADGSPTVPVFAGGAFVAGLTGLTAATDTRVGRCVRPESTP